MPTLHYLLNCAGKNCGECESPCKDERDLPCSPSCELLGADRSRVVKKCLEAECDSYKIGDELIPITIEVTQRDYIDLLRRSRSVRRKAEEYLKEMMRNELIRGGTNNEESI